MEVKLNKSQDITLKLTDEEAGRLLNGPTNYFGEMHVCSNKLNNHGRFYILLKGLCEELNTYFYLGYSRDLDEIFSCSADSRLFEIEGMGKILIPEFPATPFRINLSDKGITHFREGWPHGIRYDSSSKLFIFKEVS